MVNLVDIGTDDDTDGFVDGISVAINSTGFKLFPHVICVLGMSGGATNFTETADEVELVISATASNAGGVIALNADALQVISSDSPTASRRFKWQVVQMLKPLILTKVIARL